MQEEVQKDGGKSLDLINHPYIFMVRTIESLTSTSKLVFSWWIYAIPMCFKTSLSVISQDTVVLQHNFHASINCRARRFVYVLLMNNLWLQNKRHSYCFFLLSGWIISQAVGLTLACKLQRWKEKYFVNVGTDCGLTIAGFYYVCLSRSDGSVHGVYYDPNSRWSMHH